MVKSGAIGFRPEVTRARIAYRFVLQFRRKKVTRGQRRGAVLAQTRADIAKKPLRHRAYGFELRAVLFSVFVQVYVAGVGAQHAQIELCEPLATLRHVDLLPLPF